jgi:hypothetical protein
MASQTVFDSENEKLNEEYATENNSVIELFFQCVYYKIN